MPRTTPADVRATFDADFQANTGAESDVSDAAIRRHIKTATLMTDRVDRAGVTDEELLARLETLLAQHYLATQLPRAASQSGPSRSVSFQGSTGQGLRSTQYGQDAITLDPTGTLADDDTREDIIVSGGDTETSNTGGDADRDASITTDGRREPR